ncbi:MAG TPA: DUF1559 domain-containing protein, partial [Planctomycetaceae bacterium]|nr:DUF1559 domain-containing protein [Planctomycetaceae bacterium]
CSTGLEARLTIDHPVWFHARLNLMYPDPHIHDPPTDLDPSTGKPSWWDSVEVPRQILVRPKSLRWAAWIALLLIVLYGANLVYHAELEARESARRSSSKNTLRQHGSAFHNYVDVEGVLPPHTTTDPAGAPLHGWYTHLLPYYEQSALHSRVDFGKAWDHPDNAPLFKTWIETIYYYGVDPDVDPHGFPLMSYSANSQLLRVNSGISFQEITDGLSHTLVVGEISEALPPWGKPGNVRDPALGLKRGPDTFGGPFKGVTQFSFADGSERSISNEIDPKILKALATPAGGDDPGSDW